MLYFETRPAGRSLFPTPGEVVACAGCAVEFIFAEEDWRQPGAPFCPSCAPEHQPARIGRQEATGTPPPPPARGDHSDLKLAAEGLLQALNAPAGETFVVRYSYERPTPTPVPSGGRKRSA